MLRIETQNSAPWRMRGSGRRRDQAKWHKNVSRVTLLAGGGEGNLINSLLDKLLPVRPLGNTQRSGPRIPMSSSKEQPFWGLIGISFVTMAHGF